MYSSSGPHGTSTVLAINDILESPDSHEKWAVDMARWVRDDVASPLPELGRSGALCPFVPAALRKGTITVTACERVSPARADLVARLLDLKQARSDAERAR